MHEYLVSGLKVASEMELPGAAGAPPGGAPDIAVRFDAVPQTLCRYSASGPTWELDGERFLLRVPGLARILISNGRALDVELEPGGLARDAAAFVLGTAFGILLHQRGALVLHSSAVARDGRAIAICGPSGAGKSTLAAALCREGWAFVTDDLCVVTPGADGVPVVLPDGRRLKLWRESIEQLELAERQGDPVRERFEKYFIEPPSSAAAAPPLSAIYVLRDGRGPHTAGIEALSLPDAMRMLDYQTFRPALRARIGSRPHLLAQAAAVFGHVKVFVLNRPRGFEHMASTVAMLGASWDALGQ
jgi:hypothetical protein